MPADDDIFATVDLDKGIRWRRRERQFSLQRHSSSLLLKHWAAVVVVVALMWTILSEALFASVLVDKNDERSISMDDHTVVALLLLYPEKKHTVVLGLAWQNQFGFGFPWQYPAVGTETPWHPLSFSTEVPEGSFESDSQYGVCGPSSIR